VPISSTLDLNTRKLQGPAHHNFGMYELDELRNQHDAALCMADRLLDLVADYRCEADALPIALQLNKLVGLLRVHLAQEDVQLYPRLLASGDRDIAKLALSYVSEMGGLAHELEQFIRRWSSSAVIAADFADFAEAAQELVLQLSFRIERENRYLYPLAKPPARQAA
jgi:hemerythrin-like domain-containing protein